MISISIKTDIDKTVRELERIRRGIGERATVMALNKTAAKAKTEMVRAITSEYVIRASDVRPRMRVQRARRGRLTAVLDPFASVSRRGRSLNVVHFLERKVSLAEARRRRKAGTLSQLRFRIKKTGGPRTIKGAFIGNKGRTIFERVPGSVMSSREKYSGTKHAEGIRPVQTLGVPQMFGVRRISDRVVRRIRKEFPIEFDRAVRQVLRSRR